MSDTLKIAENFNIHSRGSHESTGRMHEKSVVIDPKWKPLFFVFIILGSIGLGAAACGIAGIGAQHHWWSAGLIDQLNQTQSLIFIFVGGIGGAGFFILGIVGIVKIHNLQQRVFDSTSSDFSKEDGTTSATVKPLRTDNKKASEQHLRAQKNNHSETLMTTSVTPPQQHADIKQEKKPATNPKGQICLTMRTAGYIGQSKRQLLPRNFKKNITLEDGSPLPLDAEDFLSELYLFNMSRRLENAGIPSMMLLPGALFKGKKDGDTIRLRYKNQLIELTIEQQNHELRYAKGAFEEVFAKLTAYIKKSCDLDDPAFAIFDPYWFYRLGDKGCIYKLETQKSENQLIISHLKDGVSEDFRPKVNPEWVVGDLVLEDETKLIFEMSFPRFGPQDFDIILTETHLIIYGRFENRPVPGRPVDLNQADINHMDDEWWEKLLSSSREALFAFRWDKMEQFKDRSMEEMKTIMNKSTCSHIIGILQLEISLP